MESKIWAHIFFCVMFFLCALILPPSNTLQQCNRELLDSFAGNSSLYFKRKIRRYILFTCRFYLHRDLTCGILNLTRELQNIYSRPGIGLRPITNELFTPWAAIDASWMDPPESKRAQCPEPIPGNLVLSPAPGEQFDLSVQLADQLLNYVFATVFMQVEGREEREVEALMQLNGLQYGIGDGYICRKGERKGRVEALMQLSDCNMG